MNESAHELQVEIQQFQEDFHRLREEIGRVIVGQREIVDGVLFALIAGGHVLLEGVPGLGKTLLVSTLGRALSLPFSRIQFTPDVMPADITGTSIVVEDPRTGRRSFEFRKGPVFHQLLLADEINRATPKSQSALLEAMQERSVSVGGTTHHLQRPFLVMATQNPIEQEGTYALPEAQLDRFFFKIVVPYATRSELNTIIGRTTTGATAAVRPIMDGPYIMQAQQLARRVVIAPHVQDFIVRLVLATHPGSPYAVAAMNRYIALGVSPRGAQAIAGGARVRALINGRYAVGYQDVTATAPPALRHRLARSFEAEADGVSADDIVERLLESVPREALVDNHRKEPAAGAQ
jgi:MoxR-like ATPase